MNNKTLVVLCILIALLAGLTAAGVYYLYRDADGMETVGKLESCAVDKPDSVGNGGKSKMPPELKKEPERRETAGKPSAYKVKNCRSGKLNTLRQNADKSLELIDETGKRQWKRTLGGYICGPVAEIDWFGNGKIQFLLCDGGRIYVIDRLGRDVSGFPKAAGVVVTKGPVSETSRGKAYWKFETATGAVYYNYKLTKSYAKLP